MKKRDRKSADRKLARKKERESGWDQETFFWCPGSGSGIQTGVEFAPSLINDRPLEWDTE